MASITIQVLEGLERGNLFQDIAPPITIGREDENAIRLNDERVSRFHAKIQEDGNRVILTDLDSTNGTRVNGHPVQMRVLQFGDQIVIGRCLLIFGSESEIAARMHELADEADEISDADGTIAIKPEDSTERKRSFTDEMRGELFPAGAPAIPRGLSLVQRAQVSDMFSYAHDRIRMVIECAEEEDQTKYMRVDWKTWQRMIQLEMDLARFLRSVSEPD